MIVTSDGRRLPTVTEKAIKGFFGEYRFLSNFHPCSVRIGELTFPSSEHAYMAFKTLDPEVRKHIATLATPSEAKRFGRTLKLRPNWEALRIKAMRKVVVAKYTQNPDLANLLLATSPKYLEETNDWGDEFWGTTVKEGRGTAGRNWLGVITMGVRDQLRIGELKVILKD
jgi:ribA/ribD-fused uncharacterized protein